ncbi:LacI family transcriptional regulator [Mucilaginibacter gracilis]|uniref:LacI family transcriptional regulator n=1 Tax=Mucilaginibacter gracilis TaxID=423350 RepID=A0A495IXK4_9SPHI|nr:LacI family DNA-binding transcriptional regulator [Mucilaginibacter gracilis]RKR80798.1 LacI family transcriptional regulator [Mucilaginibacter gracilis]
MSTEVTLKKLADMLNLSISTVSRALKDHPDISTDTKIKVKELAAVLDYEPNTYAINLRTNHSKEFGVIVPGIANDFYQAFISSLEEDARQYGFSLIIMQSGDDPLIELENVKRCKQNRMAGLFVSITSKTVDIHNFLKLDEQHIPVIFFDKVPAFEACNKVCVADSKAATMAAEALVLKRKKNILSLFGNAQLSITQRRFESFKQAFIKYGADSNLLIFNTHSSLEALEITTTQLLLNKQIDAIFCMNDEILIGAMKAVQKLGLRIPTDIGIIAISEGIIPQLYYPEITYVETSGFKLAKMAFARMLACLAGSSYVQELKIDSIVVDGGSL